MLGVPTRSVRIPRGYVAVFGLIRELALDDPRAVLIAHWVPGSGRVTG
jgi:hypothetical protein